MDLINQYKQQIYRTSDDVSGICNSLAKFGVAACEEYIQGEQLETLRRNFKLLMKEPHPNYYLEGKNEAQRWRMGEIKHQYPELYAMQDDPLANKVGQHFYGEHEHYFYALYATRDVEGEEIINTIWHQDPTGIVKFMIYLNDVDHTNGALRYNLGSHREGFYRLIHVRNGDNPEQGIYIPEEEVLFPIDVEGKAGTVIFMNTNGTHSAGYMKGEGKREMLNYHIINRQKGDENYSEAHRSQVIPSYTPTRGYKLPYKK